MSGNKHRCRNSRQQVMLFISHFRCNDHRRLPVMLDLAGNDRRTRTRQIADKVDIKAQRLHDFANAGPGNAP